MSLMVDLMERGLLPDAVVRRGIRLLLQRRLRDENSGDTELEREFIATLKKSPLAVVNSTMNCLPPSSHRYWARAASTAVVCTRTG